MAGHGRRPQWATLLDASGNPRGHVKGRKDLVASAAYLPEPAAVAAARKFVRDTLCSWLDAGSGTAADAAADGGLVDDAVLLTSELVTNAVVHAGTQVQVTCKLAGGAVEVVVRDSHPARMVPGPAPNDTVPAERTGGRGLLLPSALAAAWGVSYGTDAKAVWFRMGLPGGPAGPRGAGTGPEELDAVVPAGPWNVATPQASTLPPAAAAEISMPGESGYDMMLGRCVASAREIASADSAYALVADEDGDLGVRAASGLSPAAWLRTAPSVSTVPFMVDGRVTGVLAVAAARPGRFADGDVQRLQQLADQMGPALERARLTELERTRRARIGVLAEASALLAGSLDQDQILAVAGRVAVPRLAAWCAVLLAGPGGDLRLTVARHADESLAGAAPWLLTLGGAPAPPGITPVRPPAALPGPGPGPPAPGRWPRWSRRMLRPAWLTWPPGGPGASRSPPRRARWGCSSWAARMAAGRPGRCRGWPRTWPGGSRWPWKPPGSLPSTGRTARRCAPPWCRTNCPGSPAPNWPSRTTSPGPACPAPARAGTSATCCRWPGDAGDLSSARCAGPVPRPWR